MTIQLSQGNTYVLKYEVKVDGGGIKDLSGTSNLKYQISKNFYTDPVYSLELSDSNLTITNSNLGLVEVDIPSEVLNSIKPGKFIHELWQLDATNIPTTLVSEEILIINKLIKE